MVNYWEVGVGRQEETSLEVRWQQNWVNCRQWILFSSEEESEIFFGKKKRMEGPRSVVDRCEIATVDDGQKANAGNKTL